MSSDPVAKSAAQPVESNWFRLLVQVEFRRRDHVGLGEALGQTDANGGAPVFLERLAASHT